MTIKTLLLAGVLSLAAVSATYASDGPGNPTDGTGRSHASAAPACGDKCRELAGGASGAGGDMHASLTDTARSGQVPALWRPMLASEEGLGSGESGRGATGGRGGISGDV